MAVAATTAPPLIGRGAELEALEAALGHASAGDPVAVLVGDADRARWREAAALAAARAPRADIERAAGAAHGAATALGARHLAAAVERLARRARIALPGMAAGDETPFPQLTSREREVLVLLADGRTNRQIAEALFITQKTVSVHVSNILAKLGAANRGEAAALAHRAGFGAEAAAPA